MEGPTSWQRWGGPLQPWQHTAVVLLLEVQCEGLRTGTVGTRASRRPGPGSLPGLHVPSDASPRSLHPLYSWGTETLTDERNATQVAEPHCPTPDPGSLTAVTCFSEAACCSGRSTDLSRSQTPGLS